MVHVKIKLVFLFSMGIIRKKVTGAYSETDKILQIPTLGHAAKIGELYSAHSNQFIPGFSLWSPEDIESGKRVLWHPESSLSFGKDMSIDDISKMLSFKASISGSFAAGLLKISGSAKYLTNSKNTEDVSKVTLTYKALTRTESISSNLTTKKEKTNCTLPNKEGPMATHYVASVTYGGNCHIVYEQDLTDKEDQKTLSGELEITIKLLFFSVHARATLHHHEQSKSFMNKVSLKVFSDFYLEKQPTDLNSTLQIYQHISSNFGSKEYFYNQSVPMSVVLMPLQTICKNGGVSVEIGKETLKRATDIRLRLLNVLDNISKLLTSRASAGHFAVRELLQDFKADIQTYTLDYEHKLQTAIVGARNPKNKRISEETLINLVDVYTNSKFDYDSYLYQYLSEMTRQVNAINIFYRQTLLQDQPQIAVSTLAQLPHALMSHQKLFVLKLNVLPNVTAEKFSSWKHKSQEERGNIQTWYNIRERVGKIGHIWRVFRDFFQLNKYEMGQAFYVVLVEEFIPENIQIFEDGKEIQLFKLEKLMALIPTIDLCRTQSKIKMHVANPLKMEPPNTISKLLVNVSSNNQIGPSVFKEPIDQTSSYTSITIPNLVPEYTYNVTLAYVTEYGSLNPGRIYTKLGLFDEMEKTVGCEISNNRIKKNFKIHKYNTTTSDCAASCHSRQDCSDGWTVQLATGNCFFNIGESDLLELYGWAVGSQSCGKVNLFENKEDCLLDLPSITEGTTSTQSLSTTSLTALPEILPEGNGIITEGTTSTKSPSTTSQTALPEILTEGNKPKCCQIKIVTGMDGLDGTYSLTEEMDERPNDVCADGCVYSRDNPENEEDLYCFKKDDSVDGLVACADQN